MNLVQIKKFLPDFLYDYGIKIYKEGTKQKIKCLNPFHDEKNPSAQINTTGSVHCYGCGAVYDIIDIVRWLGYCDKDSYLSAIDFLEKNYNFKASKSLPIKNEKPLFRGHVKRTDFVMLDIDTARREYNISTVLQRCVKAGVQKPTFEKAWPFLSTDGLVSCVDFRIIDSESRKHVITAWYDGNYVRIANPPNMIWGLDHIVLDKPALIVEGAKSAEIAHLKIGDIFSVHTWNRGTGGAKYANWIELEGYEDFFLLADRDRKKDKHGNFPTKQIGLKTMETIADVLLENGAKNVIIREAHECVEKIKKDGGDIVEMFELMTTEEIINYMLKGV